MYIINVNDMGNNVYHVTMNKQNILCRTFMRFQEFYESPEFKRKIFTREEYRRWYKKDRKSDRFTYEEDWGGFNIPDYALTPFREGKFKYLLDCEKQLLKLFDGVDGKFYVIGSVVGDDGAMHHELAHALWYLKPVYKKKQKLIINKNRELLKEFSEYLLKMGYDEEVIDDELQAYLVASFEYLEKYGFESDSLLGVAYELQAVYNMYSTEKLTLD